MEYSRDVHLKVKIRIAIFSVLILLLSGEHVYSQISIPKTSDPPSVDGRVNDHCWESAALIDEFFQREPDEGAPLTERTEVFILYDADYIYFGIKCYEDPEIIAAKEMQRGASLPYDDRVHILLDTYLDGRNAYVFEVNPLGAVGDITISNSGRQQNRSWEGLFEGKAKITSQGWEAELAIPFKTLSFDVNTDRWGLFMNRYIPSKNEWGSWPVANLNSAEYAVSDAGIIEGLEGITQGIGLDISPYALAGVDTKRDYKPTYKANAGVDLFYQITPRMKASLTVNTDFAETEADTRQINLTRFNIRLSEKRNFFLDGASLFNFGLEGGRQTEAPSGKLSPFFSRRMGLDEEGSSIPIIYGVKMTSRLNNWNIGILHISENREFGHTYPAVARISRNIGQQSSVGFITTYGNALGESQNFVTGLDLNLATSGFLGNKTLTFVLHGIKSYTEDIHGKDVAWGAILTYPNDLVNFRIGYQQIGEDFYAGLGFVPRTNIREYWGSLTLGPRIDILGIRQYSFGGSFDYVTDFENIMQSQSFTITPAGLRFHSGERFTYRLVYNYEYLDRDFNIYADYIIPADEYKWWEHDLTLSTSGSRDLYGSVSYTTGKFYTGSKNSLNLSINWKIFVRLFIGGSFSKDKVNLPEGDFSADILQFNLNILFSPNITLYNYLQYDSKSKTAGLQTRFRWVLKPGNEILLVWNSGYSIPDERLAMDEDALRFKLKYNFRF
ncbi:MAG: hypothetical protein JXB19_03355 [Bacteroidales bacterium]|nr:hypothetical protein [Bacteroidales bacterium]